jgi:hypothetical protein
LKLLSRAQLSKGFFHKNKISTEISIDTTVRANLPFISPDWDHVLDLKKGV